MTDKAETSEVTEKQPDKVIEVENGKVTEVEKEVETKEVVTNEEPDTNPEEPTNEKETVEDGTQENEVETEDKPLDVDVWGDTGSEIGNSTLALLQNSGISTEDAKALLYDAVVAGDTTKIDQAALEEKVGKDKANLVMAGVKTFIRETSEKNSSIRNEVFTAAGDEDTWNKMIDWAKSNEVDLTEYAELIDAGGAKARFAVAEIKGLYNADPKNTAIPANGRASRQEPTTTANPSIKPITSAREYAELYDAAYKKGDAKEMERLTQARRLGRNSK
jgi:hypothetical protein